METINVRSTGLTMVDKVLTRGRQMAVDNWSTTVDNWSTTVDKVDKLSTRSTRSTNGAQRCARPRAPAIIIISSFAAHFELRISKPVSRYDVKIPH